MKNNGLEQQKGPQFSALTEGFDLCRQNGSIKITYNYCTKKLEKHM